MIYGKYTSKKSTPQTKPIFGRTDMVKNNAGGYVFEVSDKTLLNRFLLLGSEGGTYYVGESKLTEDNAQNVVKMIKASGGMDVLTEVLSVVAENRAPKLDPSLFVLALVCTYGSNEAKKEAYK